MKNKYLSLVTQLPQFLLSVSVIYRPNLTKTMRSCHSPYPFGLSFPLSITLYRIQLYIPNLDRRTLKCMSLYIKKNWILNNNVFKKKFFGIWNLELKLQTLRRKDYKSLISSLPDHYSTQSRSLLHFGLGLRDTRPSTVVNLCEETQFPQEGLSWVNLRLCDSPPHWLIE